MRLSTNELRNRAAAFAQKHASATYEKGETQTFYNEFFNIFGVERRQVARYEEHVKKLNNKSGFIDLFWPKVLLIEQKSAGRDLIKAAEQAGEYFDALKDFEKPRFQLVCDFQNFELLDRDTRQSQSFKLAELPNKIELFNFISGREQRVFKDQDPVNVKASELMGTIHDELEASGYKGHDLERFLVRLVFMLFADDTGIFEPRDILLDYIENRTQADGSDTGSKLAELFQVLNTHEDVRNKNLDEDLNRFPYVNGDLFSEQLPFASFTAQMRETLLEACNFNWAKVSPAIFGSLFQSVMDAKERRKKGAHYTTEKNIMKVIGPLFLDELKAEFERLKQSKRGRAQGLEAFRLGLGKLTFLDPACGCGNFLIIAYRELRELELAVLAAGFETNVKMTGENPIEQFQRREGAKGLSVIDVDQFYGIEFEEFPALIAEIAMYMMDHIMNNKLSLEFNVPFNRIPLKKSPHIKHADALETDWNTLLPAKDCSYVLGNPPFIGQSYQSPTQRLQMAKVIGHKSGKAGSLDYVGAWFLKAGAYANVGRAKIAFVSTNSITQGEQVAQLWPLLFDRYKMEIAFAHRTFAWGSEARGVAHVHVVIIGLTRADMEPAMKRLFSYEDIKGDPLESQHGALSPYLVDATGLKNRHVTVLDTTEALSVRPRMMRGAQSTDEGHYIFRGLERNDFLKSEPQAEKFLRPYIGAEEYINGKPRWILFLEGASPEELRAMPLVAERIKKVREFRLASQKPATRRLGQTPTLLEGRTIPASTFLAIPQVSSERRQYVPFGWLSPPTIPSDKLRFIENAQLHQFAVLTSAMHMAWMRAITGRMKSDYMYSVGVVYNTFPWPHMSPDQEAKISALAQAVLDARTAWPNSTLADLYDPDLMPPNLRKAHTALDLAVDKLYRKAPFASERERVEHLFGLYEKMVAPLEAAAKGKASKKK